ncbi:MAG TPA: arginine--tRNA ligase [Candidatus Babeliales bacterium]|nr:arginine--tRNA ligase [Candidatus Babeliales bacterium]
MNLIEQIQQSFNHFLQAQFSLDSESLSTIATVINTDEAKQEFGDLNSNAAMVLAKQLKKNPRELAQHIIAGFKHESIARMELAGPGFINIYLTPQAFQILALDLYESRENFFKLNPTAPRYHYNIEFVSANPTGPLHLGHGRGGIIGDVLGNIMVFLGHKATKEFYINDAGVQIYKLGQSLKIRCQQELGIEIGLPEDSYRGEYLIDLAKTCIKEYGDVVVDRPDSFFEQYAKEQLLEAIKITLKEYGIIFDTWFSEKSLHTDGSIDKTLTLLKDKGYIYEQDGALWFKSTEFGDDKDRVVRKSSGELTYIAADSAYLKNKVDRGYDHLIMVLGHDHHGYEHRMQALLKALGLDAKAQLHIIFYQLVKMKEGGELVRMSKRAGNIVTLEGVIDVAGVDVARFFYLNRKGDAQLEFDLDLALKKTEENPVYYVQYALVRTKSIAAKAAQEKLLQNINELDIKHLGPEETLLLKKIISLKQVLESISSSYQTHNLTYYVLELAQTFHSYYGKNRVIDSENPEKSRARLLLIQLLQQTFETAFTLLGISKPDKM